MLASLASSFSFAQNFALLQPSNKCGINIHISSKKRNSDARFARILIFIASLKIEKVFKYFNAAGDVPTVKA